MPADKHILRRKLLQVIRDWRAPVTQADILRDAEIIMRMESGLLDLQEIADALRGLDSHGYLANLRPGRTPLYVVTAAGTDQLDRETTLSEYVWGEHASFPEPR